MIDEFETVATFNDLTQAQGARSALQSAGIASFLRDENTGSIDWGLMPAMGGLRLQVHSADLERAREVLAALAPDADALDDPEELDHREASRRRKRLVGLISFLILLLPVLLALIFGWLS